MVALFFVKGVQLVKYNGWANYPTWAVKLWLDNTEVTYRQVQYMTVDSVGNPGEHRTAQGLLAGRLKDYVEEFTPDIGASMFSDLLGWAIEQVDWHEIATACIEEEVAR